MHDCSAIRRRLIPTLLTVAALCCATACIKDDIVAPEPVSQVTMRLVASDAATRSEGEAAFNENRIHRALIFFYAQGTENDPEAEAVYCISEENINADKIYEVSPVRLSIDQREQIFGPDTDRQAGHVFAVVNLPAGVDIPENASIKQIRETVVEADFRSTRTVEIITDYSTTPVTTSTEQGIQPDFVMFGEAWLQFDDEESKQVYGEIPLTRTAAKIRLALRVPNEIEVDADESDEETAQKEKWEPQTTGMRVYITNGVRKGAIGGAQLTRDELKANNGSGYYRISASGATTPGSGEGSSGGASGSSNNDYMTIARKVFDHTNMPNFPDEMRGTPLPDTDVNPGDFIYWHDVPLYSYPHQWENTPFEDRQTYLIVQVPWRKKSETAGEMNFQTFFYQVPINLRGGTVTEDPNDGVVGDDEQIKDRGEGDPGGFANGGSWSVAANTIESNMYYLVKLDVGMLGSFNAEDPLELKAQYYVVPWQTEEIEAKLRDNRYLVVNQTNWTMNNETDLDIPFYTSHEVVVARVKYRFWNFNPVGVRTYNENTGEPTAWYTYLDDGQEFLINNEGIPLRRTITWKAERSYDDKARDSSYVYNNTFEKTGEKIFDFSVDNGKMNIHYHHDLLRWTEYVEPAANGDEIKLFGPRETVGFTRNNNVTAKTNKTTNDFGVRYTVDGYYGSYNGPSASNNNAPNRITDLGVAYMRKTIDNETTQEEPEWSKIEVEITIIHKDLFDDPTTNYLDNTRFQQTIYITQYPAMYIEADLSDFSSVYVNARQGTTTEPYFWRYLSNAAATNNNPNMYVITITQLDDPSLIIGDPRTLTPNNNLSNASFGTGSKTSWNDGNTNGTLYSVNDESARGAADWLIWSESWNTERPQRQQGTQYQNYTLENYYPTDETTGTGGKEKFVAPKLRIASSFGNTPGRFGREMARRRCAAYQEKGYPAGRWRLPTQAEIQFITRLSRKGRIPLLFTAWNAQAVYQGKPIIHGTNGITNNSDYHNFPHYWCAQGAAYVDDTDNGTVKIFPANLYKEKGVGRYNNNTQSLNASYDAAANQASAVQVAVRCVYDEWYWTDKCGLNTFTWGDKAKANPQD